jgi:hypothetical protein
VHTVDLDLIADLLESDSGQVESVCWGAGG